MTSNGYCKLCDGEPIDASGFCAKHLRLMERGAGDGSLEHLVRAHYALDRAKACVIRAINKHAEHPLSEILAAEGTAAAQEAIELMRPNGALSGGRQAHE